ncbi:MAG: DUF4398 domain-containing protein [Myxococcales bacterium]|nr:DUF4398 domain-containing protein [Myxococcales bacterium]
MLLWLPLLLGSGGCGPALYTAAEADAAAALERAEEADGARLAPYDLHYAAAHLEKAREEAAEAHYEDALRFARQAKQSADEALARSTRNRGLGR